MSVGEDIDVLLGTLDTGAPAAPGTTLNDPAPPVVPEAVVAPVKARKYFHVPFDTMDCPVTHDVHGSVPGVKRRVLKKWGQEKYDSIDWPPLRTYAQLFATLSKWDDAKLDELATFLGEPLDLSVEDLTKKALVRAGT